MIKIADISEQFVPSKSKRLYKLERAYVVKLGDVIEPLKVPSDVKLVTKLTDFKAEYFLN